MLGVSREADNDEIKKAYRTLSRRYHPDANINNPNQNDAEEKFKEVQEAYQYIIDERERNDNQSQSYYYDFRQENSYYNNEETQRFKSVEIYLNNRKFSEAFNVLEGLDERNALWYYYHAIANQGLGNHILAVEDAEKAVGLEPNNIIYQRFYEQMKSGGQWYQKKGDEYGFSMNSSTDCCLKVSLFWCLCGCC